MDWQAHPARATVLITATALAVVGVAALLWAAMDVFLLLFAGALLGVFLSGVADAVSAALRIRYAWALGLCLVCGLAGAVLISYQVAPGIADQIEELRTALPESLTRLRSYVARHQWAAELFDQVPSRRTLLGSGSDAFERVTGVFSTTLGALTSALVVLFFGLFLAADPKLYQHGLLRLFPPRHHDRAAEVLCAVNETLWWWLLAKIASMLIVGLLTWVGLWMLDVPLAFTLALIASLLTFIPNVGPVLSAVPAMLLALLQSPMAAVWVGVLFVVIQTVESYIITPIFQQKAVSLAPALVIAAQVLMGVLGGGVGLIVATPLTAMASVLVRELYIKDVLGQPVETSRADCEK